jgi:hydrogenase/urease accessory protein HupE
MPCGCPVPPDGLPGALPIHPLLPDAWRAVTARATERLPGAEVQRWTVAVDALPGARIGIHGLDVTVADVLVRVATLDGRVASRVLRPGAASITVEASAGAAGYLRLGVEHILLGVDHLLFVLALVLIVGDVRGLVKTITAFTVAHSITLALATLGFVRVPPAPVEAVIALSIVLLARELVSRSGWTARRSWVVAFGFGLLHGFGFAGALREVGLPPRDIPAALMLFNVGVELGQLAFVGVVLAAIAAVRRVAVPAGPALRRVPAYGIGTVAAYWLIQRIAGFWGIS